MSSLHHSPSRIVVDDGARHAAAVWSAEAATVPDRPEKRAKAVSRREAKGRTVARFSPAAKAAAWKLLIDV